uniref:Importin N-terminal domain-containing protein n=1 Tax=Sphaeramia orbicularis TaxID=375764 RepID=A0A673BL19_9TELE
MADQVSTMCEQLVKAVNVIMDAETSQIYRLEALKFCEEFKETSSLCVPCGLKLADKGHSAVVRHFGLQVLEHVIKFRWNNMQQQEKVQLKECAMQLLSNGTHSILEEESHIKDVLSRITVEMIKREWPQHWPDMLKEMEALTSQGESQTELVMLILLRLAEDVITFQTLPTQRRRDIQQTLTQNMDSVFSFMMAILHVNVENYRKMKGSSGQELQARAHCRVAVAALNTLAGYIDWVSLVHITNNNCQLLEMLCLLLSEPELQLEAAECLLIAISRKGKLEDRKPFMLLFDDVAIHYILSAAQSICQHKYMEALLAFTTHSSQFLKSSTLATWGALFRHETLSKDSVVVEKAVQYLRACMTNLVKIGFPSRNNNPSCMYSCVDFDSDEDFNSFFNAFRAQQGEVLRIACRIVPLEAFQIAAEWLQYQIASPIDTGDTTCKSKTAEGLCSILSPSVVQWDAMTIFMECMVGQIFKSLEEEKLPIDQSMELLQAVLNYETKDPLILSCVLTNVSALFPFVIHRTHFLPQVLYKLFQAITFEIETGQDIKAPRTRAVKNVRRHACSSIIKICRDYPEFILPCFDMFYNHVKKLFSSNATLTHLEKSSLMEALVLISNQFKDFAKQKAFLDELLASVVAEWTSDEMKNVLWDPAVFLSFVGADQVVLEQSKETDTASLNRARLSFHLYAMLGVVKRARWPADLEEAKAGGFVVGYTSAGAPIYRNPCTAQFLASLPNLLALIRTQNRLFMPENMSRLSETFSRAHEMTDMEKNMVLGLTQPLLDIHDTPVYKTNLERMQGFFTTLYDNCFHVLGNAGVCLQRDFYTIDGLAEEITGSAFCPLSIVFAFSLTCSRVFVKQLVQSCPQEYYDSLLCPLLGPLFTYMMQRLNVKWQVINQRSSINGNLLPEAVTWFFTSVLRGLQMHGQHEVCNFALSQLAMLIYENLRPRYTELRAVMIQIPNINTEALDQFDHRLMDPSAQKVGEKKRKDQFRKLIAGTVGKALCQQFRKEVHIRNLPSLFKKPKPDKDILNSETLGLAALFASTNDGL